MNDDAIGALQAKLKQFAIDRDWEQYHTPRNLAALIATEAGELLALFRWGQNAVSERRADVCEEIADVFLAVLRFADVAEIDLSEAARQKLLRNEEKYPLSIRGKPE